MIECCELLLSWKFRNGGGNRMDQNVDSFVAFLWIFSLSACVLYYFYLRCFYKYRLNKDGSFMDRELQKKNKIN